ncbi:MAG: hypothetical protein MZV49_15130 [Rhodopseudomonas palustris]|nr:hypothetical protein [Rhodopseudomonas palustris]
MVARGAGRGGEQQVVQIARRTRWIASCSARGAQPHAQVDVRDAPEILVQPRPAHGVDQPAIGRAAVISDAEKRVHDLAVRMSRAAPARRRAPPARA